MVERFSAFVEHAPASGVRDHPKRTFYSAVSAVARRGRRLSAHRETPLDTREDRVVALMRFLLAASALVIVLFDPSEPDRLVATTYVALVGYCGYCFTLYLAASDRIPVTRSLEWTHWIDLAWFSLLIALSSGTNSIFFFGFFFSIMVAAFRWGFDSGLRVTLTSLLLFGTVGWATRSEAAFELNRFLIRPAYLLVMGYLISYWGGFHVSMARRLEVLREVAAVSNPRFGVDRTIDQLLARILRFYGADAALLVAADAAGGTATIRRRASEGAHVSSTETISLAAVRPLLALRETDAFAATVTRGVGAVDAHGTIEDPSRQRLRDLLESLDARSVLTVPWLQRQQAAAGRLFLVWKARRACDRSDVEFLQQVVTQVMPVLENVHLVDRLATDAAETERQRIARDLHDSVIQPYIGVRMGLRGIREKLRQQRDVLADLEQLEDVVQLEIQQLRNYLVEMKAPRNARGVLQTSLERFAERYADATGIRLEIDAADPLDINDRLAAEVFQMVVEAVSNVRRHTDALAASVWIRVVDNHLRLRISNAAGEAAARGLFTPTSINGRVAALGGRLSVTRDEAGTALDITIPL